MSTEDFAINARVRRVLARHWVDPSSLEIGTTDGIVVLRGPLELVPGSMVDPEDPDARDSIVNRLRHEIRSIPGVSEVIIETSWQGREDDRRLAS